ncbi:MAG: putative ABC transporter permease subunit, partial [Kiritimatiellia bacterium]
AWHQSLHPLFILWTFLFSIPFLFLCASLGAIIVLLAVRWLPKPGKFRIFAVAVAISGILAYSMFARATIDTDSAQFNLTTAIPGMRMATHPLSPGFWMSEGIMSLTRGHLPRGLLFLALLTSTACVSTMLVEQLGGLLFYPAWQRARTAGPTRRKAIMLTKLHILRRLIPADVCAIINKDIRTFLRDPAQWSQALVFFGLLGLYFSNLRLFRYDQFPEQWRSLMTFLNIFAVSAVLSSMGSRFIYPQLSFEGHSFWMLGLSPATMPRILAAKYLLALFSTGLVSITLIFLSTRSLNLEPLIQTAALALIAAVCLSVCALSVGLGAIFIDLDEHNPSAIVSSFGGTLNIILCLCYMFVTIMPFGVLFHMRQSQNLSPAGFTRLLTAVYAWLALLTTLATTLPLWLGYRSLRKRDF